MSREVSYDPNVLNMATAETRPFTPMQALMEAAPGDEILPSTMEMLALRDVLADAMEDSLTALESWVFTSVVIERKSLRELGREINRPKTTIARIRDMAAKKLQTALQDHPAITHHLESHTP